MPSDSPVRYAKVEISAELHRALKNSVPYGLLRTTFIEAVDEYLASYELQSYIEAHEQEHSHPKRD